jgi:hypothetical protein
MTLEATQDIVKVRTHRDLKRILLSSTDTICVVIEFVGDMKITGGSKQVSDPCGDKKRHISW